GAGDPIVRQRPVDAAELPRRRCRDSCPAFDVFRLAEALVEPAGPAERRIVEGDSVECLAPDDGRRSIADRIAAEDIARGERLRVRRLRQTDRPRLLVDQARMAEADADRRVRIEMALMPFEL